MTTKSSAHSNSAEFIDATQNAVIEVVDNVSEMITATNEMAEISHQHYDVFYHNPTFWVGMAFVIVVVALAKPIGKVAKKALTQRRNSIIDKINEAEKLRDDAQELLAQYERKFLHAKDEAAAILEKSTQEINRLNEIQLQKMEKELSLKQKEVESLIEATVEKTKNEISQLASAKAVSIAKDYISSNLDQKHHAKLIDYSIDNIENIIKPQS